MEKIKKVFKNLEFKAVVGNLMIAFLFLYFIEPLVEDKGVLFANIAVTSGVLIWLYIAFKLINPKK